MSAATLLTLLLCAPTLGLQEPDVADRSLESTAPAAVRFGLLVRDFESEEVLGGAEIALEEVPGIVAWRGVSDARGRAEIVEFPAQTKLQLVLRRDGYAARRISAVVTGGEEFLRVYLMRAATLSLQLPPREPQEAAGRALRLEPLNGSAARLLLQDETYLLPVGDDGVVGPVRVCNGSYVATLREGGIDRCEWNLDAPVEPSVPVQVLDYKRGTCSVSGRVLDENGQPRPGARLRLVAQGERAARLIAFSNALGLFEFDQLPPGGYRVQVMRRVARNFLDAQDLIMHSRAFDVFNASRQVHLDAETPQVDVHFGYDPKSVNVTGILLSEGVPVPGWRVLLEDRATGDTWLSEFSRTDGMFDIPGLRPNSRLNISYETSTAWVPGGEFQIGNDEREVHTLSIPPFLFSGQVFYSQTRLSPDEGRLVIEGSSGDESTRWLAWLGPDGTFEVPGLQPGTYEVWVQASRCKDLRRRLIVDADGAHQIDVELEVEWIKTP